MTVRTAPPGTHQFRRLHMKKLIMATAFASLAFAPALAQQKTAATSDGRVVYISKAPGDAASIGTYYNRNVYNTAGEKLGDVNDLLLGPDRTISTAVIGVGGFLGMGEKEVAVPFDRLQVVSKDNNWHLVMDATKEALTAAPAFERVSTPGGVMPAPARSTNPSPSPTATPPAATPPATTPPAATPPKQ
jgi:sporulation protein YlmC with PRC-barrel domain